MAAAALACVSRQCRAFPNIQVSQVRLLLWNALDGQPSIDYVASAELRLLLPSGSCHMPLAKPALLVRPARPDHIVARTDLCEKEAMHTPVAIVRCSCHVNSYADSFSPTSLTNLSLSLKTMPTSAGRHFCTHQVRFYETAALHRQMLAPCSVGTILHYKSRRWDEIGSALQHSRCHCQQMKKCQHQKGLLHRPAHTQGTLHTSMTTTTRLLPFSTSMMGKLSFWQARLRSSFPPNQPSLTPCLVTDPPLDPCVWTMRSSSCQRHQRVSRVVSLVPNAR